MASSVATIIRATFLPSYPSHDTTLGSVRLRMDIFNARPAPNQ
jgi:hypothetical protein